MMMTASAAEPAATDSAIITYSQDYFAEFNAITAEDLLNRIPGIQEVLRDAGIGGGGGRGGGGGGEQNQRGFGSTGSQILINGRRLSGKSNSVGAALQRIQARQVVRVEVIRGSVPGLDVRSEGTVVNVVLSSEMVAGSGAWEANASHYSAGLIKPGGKVSYSGDMGALSYIAGLELAPRFDRRNRQDLLYRPGSPPFERQKEDQRVEGEEYVATGSLAYALGLDDLFNLNARYADETSTDVIPTDIYTIAANGTETYIGHFIDHRELPLTNWEVGGDWEHTFGGGRTFKLLTLYNSTSQRDERSFSHIPPGGIEIRDRLQVQVPKRSEAIARGSCRFPLTANQSIEAGVEGALNKLNQAVTLFTYANGVERNVPLFNPEARISEKRGETFTTYSWQPRPSINVEAAVDTEYSQLKQRGRDVNLTRSFFFVRPRLDLRWDITPLDQIRARAVRTVSQLDFAEFVSGFNQDDQTADTIRAGNPDLVPEKVWQYTLAYEHRFADDQGLVSLQGTYEDYTDHIERIPIGTTASATGNIGSARAWGIDANLAIRLGWLGLDGASIDAQGSLRDSETIDPFTLTKRQMRMTRTEAWSVSFRHDTSWRGFSYGATLQNFGKDQNYDFNYFHFFYPSNTIDAFAEIRLWGGITARLDMTRVIRVGNHRMRHVYAGSRGLNQFRHIEDRRSIFDRTTVLALRGTF